MIIRQLNDHLYLKWKLSTILDFWEIETRIALTLASSTLGLFPFLNSFEILLKLSSLTFQMFNFQLFDYDSSLLVAYRSTVLFLGLYLNLVLSATQLTFF